MSLARTLATGNDAAVRAQSTTASNDGGHLRSEAIACLATALVATLAE